MKKSILIYFLLSFSFFGKAQNYIVLTKGDTLKGVVKIVSFDNLDRVQVNGTKKQMFTAMQVKSLAIEKQEYRPYKLENSIRFMQVLKSGYLSLLAFKANGTGSWDGRYLYKMDGAGMEVPNLSFKKSLGKFLSDCPAIEEKLDKGEFSKKDIEKIIDLYNACMQAKSDEKLGNREVKPTASENIAGIEKVAAINSLITKVDAGDFLSKEDASDLLKDVLKKVEKGEKIPNYLTEGLKSYLDKTPLKGDLENLLELLKK
jgi:hypothetical protein